MRSTYDPSRRQFISGGVWGLTGLVFNKSWKSILKPRHMEKRKHYDVIVVGGSYSGLAAAMTLGRALKQVLVIDDHKPCNRQTPQSHNFITQDGKSPGEIAALARQQVENYSTVEFFDGRAVQGAKTESGFEITTESGQKFTAKKLIFASGINDLLPELEGIAECWGISVLHCPYCHGYEVKNEPTGVLGNGDYGFEFSAFISNWTKDLTLFTNGKSLLTKEQTASLQKRNITIFEKEIAKLEHRQGYLQQLVFKDGTVHPLKAMYTHSPFTQKSTIPQNLGCFITEEGYIQVDALQKTSIAGVYACGDNTTRLRSVAVAVAQGTTAGMMLAKEMILEEFKSF